MEEKYTKDEDNKDYILESKELFCTLHYWQPCFQLNLNPEDSKLTWKQQGIIYLYFNLPP